MTIKDDCIRHKILIQKYATRQANLFVADIRHLTLLSPDYPKDKTTLWLNAAIEKQYNAFVEFANYESRFNAKLYTKYLKKDVSPILIDKMQIETFKLGLALHKPSTAIGKCFNDFRDKKIDALIRAMNDAKLMKTNHEETTKDLIYGLFSTQAKALINTAVNCIAMKVRVMF